jgi:hypothetical protein
MEQFALKWRFTDPRYRALPPVHLEQVKPLSSESSRRLWGLTLPLHEELPFTTGFFRVVESIPLDNADATRAIRVKRAALQPRSAVQVACVSFVPARMGDRDDLEDGR